ncbi:unnamed protein product [Mytilus coruscus]|uniref:Uncharacterized protein n=1 Tax=Mytilus coruscus TaxID=42192 RepID=A0A6J8DKB1_MYTCO|nr:unnamed protein product [Mytilus coruscus]
MSESTAYLQKSTPPFIDMNLLARCSRSYSPVGDSYSYAASRSTSPLINYQSLSSQSPLQETNYPQSAYSNQSSEPSSSGLPPIHGRYQSSQTSSSRSPLTNRYSSNDSNHQESSMASSRSLGSRSDESIFQIRPHTTSTTRGSAVENTVSGTSAAKAKTSEEQKDKKVIGKFKDELNGKIMNEIVYLRSKAYSFTFIDLNQIKEEEKLKGIGKTTITKDIKFDDYKDCLFSNKTKMNKCIQMNSKKHEMFVNEVNKISTNPFDDKRYILDNGIDTLPFGF